MAAHSLSGAPPVSIPEMLVADADGGVNDLFEGRTNEGLTEEKNIPGEIGLGVSPNPSNPATVVKFSLPHDSEVELSVFNRICAPFFEPVDGLISAKDSGGIIGFGMNLE